jgi:hypothetical protein
MIIKEILLKIFQFISFLITLSICLILAFGNIFCVLAIFIGAPFSLLILFRRIFPQESKEFIIKFSFSWFDLILYLPGVFLGYFLLVKIVYPFSSLIIQNFVIWPIKKYLKDEWFN